MGKWGYAIVGSVAEADAIEELLKAKGDREALTVKEACKRTGAKYAEADVPEGSVGPIVVIHHGEAEPEGDDA